MSTASDDCARCRATDCAVRKGATLKVGQRVRYDGYEWTVLGNMGDDDPENEGTFVLEAEGDQDFNHPVVYPDMVETVG